MIDGDIDDRPSGGCRLWLCGFVIRFGGGLVPRQNVGRLRHDLHRVNFAAAFAYQSFDQRFDLYPRLRRLFHVPSAQFQAALFRGFVTENTVNNNWYLGIPRIRGHHLADRQTVARGHIHVENNQIGIDFHDSHQCVCGVGRTDYLEAELFQPS